MLQIPAQKGYTKPPLLKHLVEPNYTFLAAIGYSFRLVRFFTAQSAFVLQQKRTKPRNGVGGNGFAKEKINETEGRAVLHVALRAPKEAGGQGRSMELKRMVSPAGGVFFFFQWLWLWVFMVFNCFFQNGYGRRGAPEST